MSAALRLWMVALVAVNLLFVFVTEAASLEWLLPMLAATLAAPALVRLQRFLVYRLAWNLAVVAIFALLVQHATTAGIHFLLEDGLRLAAISQVHLVNNLGEKQRPDLLFFNSFLIAIVTAFLTQAFAYSMVFALYAPLFLIALQVYSAVGHGEALGHGGQGVAPGLLRAVARDGLKRACLVGLCTAFVFVAWPRDFHRRGLLGKHFDFASAAPLEVGFSEEVQLERTGAVGVSDAVVFRVQIESGTAGLVPTHWRGATFLQFDGARWERGTAPPAAGRDLRWREQRAGVWTRALGEPGAWARVEQADQKSERLFLPLTTRRLELRPPTDPLQTTLLSDGTVRYAQARQGSSSGPLRYELQLAAAEPPTSDAARLPPNSRRTALTQLPARVPPIARSLSRSLAQQMPADATERQVVDRMLHDLSTRFRYLPPGADGGAADLEGFLSGASEGAHCEYFASALALLLRLEGIPCRVVTGFLSDEWDTERRTLTVRQRHAHAWVEVLDPVGGWYTADPSPALAARGGESEPSLWRRMQSGLGSAWTFVVSFDDDARTAAASWLRELPGRSLDAIRRQPVPAVACVLLGLGLLLARRRLKQRRTPLGVRQYRACLRRAGLELRVGETPRELLARARATGTDTQHVTRLEAATEAHERERYAGASGR